jgi:hypothetical protein
MMETGSVVQLLSTFNAKPIEASLQRALAGAGVAEGVDFTSQEKMSAYMVAPASDTEHILGTAVLIRVEDWLRDALQAGVSEDARVRQELQTRVREFVNELTILSYRGKPVWFLACPSTGWVSQQSRWGSLCQTYTNLLGARIRNLSQVTTLNWPATLSRGGSDDRKADQAEKIPFTQDAFDQLGEFVAAQVGRTLAQSDGGATQSGRGGSPELAAYLAGLRVEVELAPAKSESRGHVDRILRTAASFSLTGEKPDISDAEVEAILQSEGCVLISVSDRLAAHGPSGIVVYRWVDDALVVDSMSLSCTVLGKQVEYAVLSALARMAAGRHCSRLLFEYRPSGRNQPMLTFLRSVADRESDTQYALPLDGVEARLSAAAVNPGAWSIRQAETREQGARTAH